MMMNSNTFKTFIGFIATMVEKYTPLKLRKDTLEGIFNYLSINETVSTSGQPTEKQFKLIRGAGYQLVINLALHYAENALPDESGLLKKSRIMYIHIPVDFKNPTNEDFQQFVEAMKRSSTEKI